MLLNPEYITTTILKYQKPMIAWSKAGNHIGGSLFRFMPEFGKRETSFRVKILKTSQKFQASPYMNTTCRKLDQISFTKINYFFE